MKRISIP